MFALSCLAELIGFSLGLLFTQVSRRKLLILYLISAVIPLVLVALIPATESSQMTLNNALIMLFAFIGKIQVSACFYLGNKIIHDSLSLEDIFLKLTILFLSVSLFSSNISNECSQHSYFVCVMCWAFRITVCLTS